MTDEPKFFRLTGRALDAHIAQLAITDRAGVGDDVYRLGTGDALAWFLLEREILELNDRDTAWVDGKIARLEAELNRRAAAWFNECMKENGQ